MKTAANERAAMMVELAAFLPLFLIIFVATFDLGRLVYASQIVTNLAREAASLASRGASDFEVVTATEASDGMLDVSGPDGGIIISTIRRHSSGDGTPWVVAQAVTGALPGLSSRVGSINGAAAVPNLSELPEGVTLRSVEVEHKFTPVFECRPLGLGLSPPTVHHVAFV